MKPTQEATVDRAAFVQATWSRVIFMVSAMKGARRKRNIQDTLLYAKDGALVVDVPDGATPLPMEGAWPVCVSVSAKALVRVCPLLRPAERLSVIFAAGQLILDNGAFVLPATEAKAPKGAA